MWKNIPAKIDLSDKKAVTVTHTFTLPSQSEFDTGSRFFIYAFCQ
jgi:hypothetical protein